MKDNITIQKTCSFLLACIFALSITPKIIIHDLVANHKDISYCTKDFTGQQLSRQGFHCHFENLVAESPFLFNHQAIPLAYPAAFNKERKLFLPGKYFIHPLFSALRGPPAILYTTNI